MLENVSVKKPTTVTREELYKQVWETPMSRLAEEYGISGNGLAKICRRLNVPYPPRGWWARKAAGQKVVQYRLPDKDADTPAGAMIRPTPSAPEPPIVPPEVQDKVETATKAVPKIVVPERLGKPHPVIAKWLADHEKRKDDARDHRKRWGGEWPMPPEPTSTDRRRHRILDALFKVLEAQGGKIADGEKGEMSVTLLKEKISFRIIEKQKQVKIPYENDPTRHQREMVPTGKLLFKVERWLPSGLPKEWLETDTRSMEDMLPEIIGTMVAAAPLLVEETQRRQEEEHRRWEAQRQRDEEERRRKVGANRWRRFVEIAKMWEDARLATAFIDELKMQELEPDMKIGDKSAAEWLAWAEDYANFPLDCGVEAIFKDVNSKDQWSYRD